MDDNLYQDDFEEFLQDQVRNQRMYPSDAVWRNINKELHGDNKWPALTISAFALLIATVAVCIHFSPKPNIFAVPATYNQKVHVDDGNEIANLSSPSFLITTKKTTAGNLLKPISGNSGKAVASKLPGTPVVELLSKGSTSFIDKLQEPSLAKVISMHQPAGKPAVAPSNLVSLATLEGLTDKEIITLPSTPQSAIGVTNNIAPKSTHATNPIDQKERNGVDDFLKEHSNDLALYTTTQTKSLKNRFSYVIYVAPSISYRKLNEDRSAIKDNTALGGGPVALNYVTDVNKVVRHKPGTGIEAGLGIIYNVSNKFRIRSGLQFNVRQYNIEAYRSSGERAGIALLTGANRIDTIYTSSVYRTNNGFVSAELVNRYYQVAIPLGLELEVIGNKRIQLNIAASIQPTYMLNKNAYMLSANYKNYTESRGMINNFNLNSNVETFISFKVGDYKWQLGPQLRYQHFSTFITPYPIKEHLMDYGFKLGVSKIIF